MTIVSMNISDELFAFAEEQAALFGYFSTEDYLNGMLDMTLLSARNDFLKNGPLCLSSEPSEAEREFFDELEEDEGGGMRLKEDEEQPGDDESGQPADLDDGIPF